MRGVGRGVHVGVVSSEQAVYKCRVLGCSGLSRSHPALEPGSVCV